MLATRHELRLIVKGAHQAGECGRSPGSHLTLPSASLAASTSGTSKPVGLYRSSSGCAPLCSARRANAAAAAGTRCSAAMLGAPPTSSASGVTCEGEGAPAGWLRVRKAMAGSLPRGTRVGFS
jgi:hypothetical protein